MLFTLLGARSGPTWPHSLFFSSERFVSHSANRQVCSRYTTPPPPPPQHRVTEGKVHHRLMSWWKLEQASCYLSPRPTFLGRRSIFIPNAEKLFFPLLLFPGNLEAPAATAARALGKTAAVEDKNNYGTRVFHQRHFSTFTSQPGVLISLCCWKALVGFKVLKFSLMQAQWRSVLLGLGPTEEHEICSF